MRRLAIFLSAFLACAAAGFGAATVIGAAGDRAGAAPDQLGGKPDSASVEHREADPKGQGEWGVVVFTAKNGQTCAAAGRRSAGKVGTVHKDGTFKEYPIEDGASCIDLDAVPAGAQLTSDIGGDGRTIVHGLAGPKVRSITVASDQGSRSLPFGPRGSFLAVFGPEVTIRDVTVTATLKDGTVLPLLGAVRPATRRR